MMQMASTVPQPVTWAAGRAVAWPLWPGPGAHRLPGRPMNELWWLNPMWCVGASLLVYACLPAFDYSRWVPNAYIPGWQYAWGACLLLAMIIGAAAMTASQLRAAQQPEHRAQLTIPAWVMGLLLVLTLFAYLVWFSPLLANPGLLVEAIERGQGNVRRNISTTPGVTTMTQFGVAYVIAYAVRSGARLERLRWWEHAGLVLVLLAAVARSIAWGERLAVIEVVVCGVVAALGFARIRRPGTWRFAVLAPMLGPPLVLAAFTGTEYFRSWVYYKDQYDSVWQFAFERLLAYYATAVNNGIGLLVENDRWPQYSGRYLAEWLYFMPGGVGEATTRAFGDVSQEYTAFLLQYARIELNNPSGLFPIVFDVGYLGSMLYFLLVGALIGRLWLGWRRHELAGALFYPPCMLFMIEVLRINYLGATRFFPIVLALLLIHAAARSTRPAVPATVRRTPPPQRHRRARAAADASLQDHPPEPHT